jgi:hypothetical protein
MSMVWRYLVAGVFMLAVAFPLFFQTPQSVAPTAPVPSAHPDLSGDWVRIHDTSNFILDGLGAGETAPIFGKRVHISLSSHAFPCRTHAAAERTPVRWL